MSTISVKHFCTECERETNHVVIAEHGVEGPDHYHCRMDYQIVRCNGCDEASFRYVFNDYEQAYPTSETDWEVPQDVRRYPTALQNHSALDGLSHVPGIVRQIYEEALVGLREGAPILAGLGLRGTIEAICNEQKIKGRSLEARINKLANAGLISARDSERLHAIRFLGNDAAHEIKSPSAESLRVALRIIEHLIATVYILDKEAAGRLDTIVANFEEFKQLLERQLRNYASGDEYPLAQYLGKDVRRLPTQLSAMEAELIARINDCTYTRLKVGRMGTFNNSPTDLQHFVVA
jgi:hypothetical protein